MINLIPPQGHIVVRREYALRVGAAFAFLFGSICLILAASFIPTYILTSAQIADLNTRMTEQSDTEGALRDAEREVKTIHAILAQLDSYKHSPSPSELIREVEVLAPDGVTFKTFAVNSTVPMEKQTKDKNTGTPNETVVVQGVAATRGDLVRFKNALEASPLFERAEVPIADLARDVDLPFAITITLTP